VAAPRRPPRTREEAMANIVIWGKTRDLLAGNFPAGITSVEVDSLAALRESLDGSATLILADPTRIEADREAVESWLKDEGSQRGLLVAITDGDDGDEVLRRLPFLDDALPRPISPGHLRHKLERAFEAIHSRRVIRQLERALSQKSDDLDELNKIGVALSAERDINKLLELILGKSREITAADAGSLYLVERGKEDSPEDARLRFKLTQNDSVVAPFEESTMALNDTSIAGYAALTGRGVNVADAYDLPSGSPFKIGRSFDEKSGYRTKSMLVVPMRDHMDKVIGVVQLINKKRDARMVLRPVGVVDEYVIPFTTVDKDLVTSLASQAAVAFENTLLIQDIKNLFDSFVNAAVVTIERRDPATSGHSSRVAVLTVGLAEHVDAASGGPFRDVHFTRDQLQEIRYASLLHDFGKVGVKEKYLLKEKKLYRMEMLLVRQRFAYIKRTIEAEHLRAKLDQVLSGRSSPDLLQQMDQAHAQSQREIDQIIEAVVKANEPTILDEERFQALLGVSTRTFPDIDGNAQPLLSPDECHALSIRRGSLSVEERRMIEQHVTFTFNFLAQLPWTGEFRRVAEIAHAHHEKLDGTGYPRKLTGPDIPVQSRMMTIADIFDALTSLDRPYKRSVAVTKALDILVVEEAGRGKIDKNLLDVFIEAKVYEKTHPRAGAEVSR
jgi:HD-GYP domain-containing protein (c-di-GMP phosphodiesterase class II)